MVLSLASVNTALLLPLYHLAASSSFATWVVVLVAFWLPYLAGLFAVAYVFVSEDEDRELFRTLQRLLLPVLVAWVAALIVKQLISEPRPFVGDLGITPLVPVFDPFGSFPSAHATFFGALAAAMAVARFPYVRIFFGVAVLVAVGRVAAGVHWPSDVFVGLLWGVGVGFFVARTLRAKSGKNS